MMAGATRLRAVMAELRDARTRSMLVLPLTLPFRLRRFFGDQLTLEEAVARLRRALDDREKRFLELARARIYADRDGVYAKLLRHAGCDLADLDASLRGHGLEGTLERLAIEGVHLTPSEFKGKADVVRGGLSFRVRPRDLEPGRWAASGGAAGAFVTQSSGSTSGPAFSVSSLVWQREETPAVGAFLQAHDLLAHRHAVYEPLIPGVGGIVFAMMMTRFGIPLERWFARPVPTNGRLEAAYFRVTAAELALAGTWFGPGFASAEMVGSDGLDRIVGWAEAGRREGRPVCIRAVASNAARIARVAISIGASLKGCKFITSGEPLTPAKRRVIEQAGADVTVLWGYEPGPTYVGLGCARPAHGDEMHVLRHTLAVIQHPAPIVRMATTAVHPLLFTTLYPSATRLQLNVANGDYAVLSERSCGCTLEEAGLTTHVHGVGSYEKLTSEGLAYSHDGLLELLETTLPAEFGGGAGDYQIVEEEDAGGQTYLTLVVDPAVGSIDEPGLLDRFGAALATGSRGNRFMSAVWREAGSLRVRREAPVASPRGKVLPLRMGRRARSE